MNENQEPTWDDIKKMFDKSAQLMEKSSKKFDKMVAENARERKEAAQERKEAAQRRKEIDKQIAELNRNLGGISNSNGEIAEEYFYNTFKRDKTFANEKFDQVRRRIYKEYYQDEMECDIFLFNGKSAAIIEVKYNAKSKNVSVNKLIARVEPFKRLFPEYQNHNIYLGVAALSFRGSLVKKLHQAGIATIHQIGKRMVVYDKDVKAF